MRDGSRLQLKTATAIIQIDGREAPATVLIGRMEEPILGVEALEGLGLKIDPKKERLILSRHYAVRLGGYR